MKSIFLIVFAYFFLSANSKNEDVLDDIRQYVKQTDSVIGELEKLTIQEATLLNDTNPDNNPLEAAKFYQIIQIDIVKYFRFNEITKIEVSYKGTHQDLLSEYYFEESKLVFARSYRHIFHKSRYHLDFNKDDFTNARNYFYFHNNHLLRWINEKDLVASNDDAEFTTFEHSILHDAEIYYRLNPAQEK